VPAAASNRPCAHLLTWVKGARLGLYFVELGAAPRPISVIYDRAASAFAQAASHVFDWDAIAIITSGLPREVRR